MAKILSGPPRFTHPEWTYSNQLKYRSAEAERAAAERLQAESGRIIDETAKQTEKTQADVNKKIQQRLDDVDYWKQELDGKVKGLKEENDCLETYIQRIEKAIENVVEPLHISQQCLMNREKRAAIDLVHDDVQKELIKEVEINNGVQALLQKTLEQSKEQLRLNRKATYRLEQDIKDKSAAKGLDEYCSELRNNSHDLHFTDGTAGIDAKSVTPEEWESFSNENILNGERERQNSLNLRSIVDGLLQQTANDMVRQKNTVNLVFQRRIAETKDTKAKLEEHLEKVLGKICDMEENIVMLEKGIEAKRQPLQLSETRLDVRKSRPNIELCRDPVQYRLVEEVQQINSSVEALQQRLAGSQVSLKGLVRRQLDLEEDIQVKANTLFVDEVQCLSMRQSINICSY